MNPNTLDRVILILGAIALASLAAATWLTASDNDATFAWALTSSSVTGLLGLLVRSEPRNPA